MALRAKQRTGKQLERGAFAAAPSDVKALISWLENRDGVKVNITIQTIGNVTCSYIKAANTIKAI